MIARLGDMDHNRPSGSIYNYHRHREYMDNNRPSGLPIVIYLVDIPITLIAIIGLVDIPITIIGIENTRIIIGLVVLSIAIIGRLPMVRSS